MTQSLSDAGRRFLEEAGWAKAQVAPLAGDASFRRYHRLQLGSQSRILMEAPPAHEAVEPFIAVGRYLAGLGLSVPTVLAADPAAGFVLLEDLGDALFPVAIASGASEAELYAEATRVLAHVHSQPAPKALAGVASVYSLPVFDVARFQREVDLVLDWYWPEAMGAPAADDIRQSYQAAWTPLWDLALASPTGLVQFDYHSPNLMWLPDRQAWRRVGVLDFQDSLQGPAAYDVVSLLQDPRRDVPDALETDLMARYLAETAVVDQAAFRAAYAVLGAQRASRILGVFVRLWRRDGKPGYLRHQPRVWRLLERNLQNPALSALKIWFDQHLPPPVRGAFWSDKG
jgi:N-acetylmuramate 1-kinase